MAGGSDIDALDSGDEDGDSNDANSQMSVDVERKGKLPKGTSDYQKDWLLNSDGEADEEILGSDEELEDDGEKEEDQDEGEEEEDEDMDWEEEKRQMEIAKGKFVEIFFFFLSFKKSLKYLNFQKLKQKLNFLIGWTLRWKFQQKSGFRNTEVYNLSKPRRGM